MKRGKIKRKPSGKSERNVRVTGVQSQLTADQMTLGATIRHLVAVEVVSAVAAMGREAMVAIRDVVNLWIIERIRGTTTGIVTRNHDTTPETIANTTIATTMAGTTA
jgi:hypothetical protein